METTHGNLTVIIANSHIDITNRSVMIRLVLRDGGYAQEYYALDKDGEFQLVLSSLHKSLIPSSEHRASASPMISGSRPHLFAVSRDSLRMVYTSVEIISHTTTSVVILLTGSAMGHNLKQKTELREGENSVHITVEDNMDHSMTAPLVEYLMSSYAFVPGRWAITLGSDIDYTWAPVLRPGDDQIIGDRAFHSPAVIVQHGHMAAALIPDLHTLSKNRPMPTALDLDTANGLLSSPLISYGFCGYEESGGSFIHDMTMAERLDPPHLKYGYELLIDANCKRKSIHRQMSNVLWERGRKWRVESTEQCNSTATSTNLHNNKAANFKLALLEPDAWAAYGVYSTGDRALKKGANAVINALLAAPKYAGLFSTKFDTNKRIWAGCNIATRGAHYHSVECSRQCLWLLRWYTDIDQDLSIVNFCKDYADFLCIAAHGDGSIPSFFDKYAQPLPTLLSSSQTAISALFLARFGSITGDSRYTQAAQKAIKFIIKNSLYQDHTLIDTQNHITKSIRDPHTDAYPQSGWPMLWSAMTCSEIFETTRDRRFIEQGASILDQLCLLQSVWGRFGSIPFGACARGNIDISADIELTAGFALCAMRYARATGEKRYFERGAAALKTAMHTTNPSALTFARVAALDKTIRRSFGLAYVHVGKKWAFPVNGATIQNASFGQGKLSLTIADAQTGPPKIVFGGMRSKAYRLRINRCEITCSADEMRSGIPIPHQ